MVENTVEVLMQVSLSSVMTVIWEVVETCLTGASSLFLLCAREMTRAWVPWFSLVVDKLVLCTLTDNMEARKR